MTRAYDNTLRLSRAAETHDRILDAAVELLRSSSIRDWRSVTIRAVAERAGVNQRTVFRHFANERALRDAVMHRLEEQNGVELAELRLGDIGNVAARTFHALAGFPHDRRPALDPTLADAKRRQHEALLRAIAPYTDRWPEEDRRIAAAVMDALWSVATYERLTEDWDLDTGEAVRGVTWVLALVASAIRSRPVGLEV